MSRVACVAAAVLTTLANLALLHALRGVLRGPGRGRAEPAPPVEAEPEAEPGAAPESDEVVRLRTPARWSAAWIVCGAVVVAGLIGMAEVDRLISAVVGADGRTATVGQLVGPAALGSGAQEAWEIWGSRTDTPLPWFVVAHVLWDLLFAFAVWLLLRNSAPYGRVVVRRLVDSYLIVELVEAGVLGAAAVPAAFSRADDAMSGWAVWPLAVVSTAKWLVVACLAITLARDAAVRGRVRETVRRTAKALWVQRLSFVVVAMLGLLSLVPSGGVFDQLPDVQRGWLDAFGAEPEPRGARHMWWALGTTVVAAGLMFLIGRQRAERAWTTYVCRRSPRHEPSYVWWFVGPVAAAAGVVLMYGVGRRDLVDHATVAVFILVPVALVCASAILRYAQGHRGISAVRATGYGLLALVTVVVATVQLVVSGNGATQGAVGGARLDAVGRQPQAPGGRAGRAGPHRLHRAPGPGLRAVVRAAADRRVIGPVGRCRAGRHRARRATFSSVRSISASVL